MTKAVEDHLAAGYAAALDELKAFCRLPSISTDAAYGDGIRAAAQFAAGALGRSGLPTVEIVETGGHPVVFAEGPKLPGKGSVANFPFGYDDRWLGRRLPGSHAVFEILSEQCYCLRQCARSDAKGSFNDACFSADVAGEIENGCLALP